jgi:glutamate dehydrogenase
VSNQAIITDLVAYIKTNHDPSVAIPLSKFARIFYANVCEDDLIGRSLVDLHGALFSHWTMCNEFSRDIDIKIFNPTLVENGWHTNSTVVMIVCKDMPFLVDTTRMFLAQHVPDIYMLLHTGGVRIHRDKTGVIDDILPHSSVVPDSELLAPIYVEITYTNDVSEFEKLILGLKKVLNDVYLAVADWQEIIGRLELVLDQFEEMKECVSLNTDMIIESQKYIEWLIANHFTFLGYREYDVVGSDEAQALQIVPGSGLGVLRDDSTSKSVRQYVDMPPQARIMILSKDQLIISSKTNTRSTVHRPAYTDCIDIKFIDVPTGKIKKVVRLIGLFTSAVYNSTDLSEMPIYRCKVASVLQKSGLPPASHAGKDLVHILATIPRDDLFHASVEELYELGIGILQLQDRRKVKLFVRRDSFHRFFSCIVFIPKDKFNTELLHKFESILMQNLHGKESYFNIHFSESLLAGLHYVIRVDPTDELDFNIKDIEDKFIHATKTWMDDFRECMIEYFGEIRGNELIRKYKYFPASYRENYTFVQYAIADIEYIEKLSDTNPLEMSCYVPDLAFPDRLSVKLYQMDETIPLSDALPMLENMGLRVIGENPHEIVLDHGRVVWVNDFNVLHCKKSDFNISDVRGIFQECFLKTWYRETDNDRFNHLVLLAQLNWREIFILRTYARYCQQISFPFSLDDIAEALCAYPQITKVLVDIFQTRFDPRMRLDRVEELESQFKTIMTMINDVSSLSHDRIFRQYLQLMKATVRCNYYQHNSDGDFKKYLSLKFVSSKVPDMPLPMPKFDIFVSSPSVEGIHIRMPNDNNSVEDPETIARGGIRWSQRPDYRDEVRNLASVQRVKNAGAGIVPTGAKGGYILRHMPADATREQIQEAGIAGYKLYINGLLDCVDNLVQDEIVTAENTICYDQPDHYLVVAADKGTATFSDIANEISQGRKFWLQDAFASGGSAGYDHKKMGITAKGAWISAAHHFKTLGIDIASTDITVVGIGDMAGDVFGNGMLMTKHIRLVAAFNHQHIFIDPNPDAASSYEERTRLFNLPRSSWEDYNVDLISAGGGVYLRSAKSISLSTEAQDLLATDKETLTPSEIIKLILKAKVDLLWNGGIGTFVKASTEANHDVADRSNDSTRVNGADLNAKVVCEGGNLGFTPLSRIEYELVTGGKINTDFIDNAGGVDCSDHEVNMKILLNNLVASNCISIDFRNKLLESMTQDVSRLVVENNYRQNEALGYVAAEGYSYLNLYGRYLNYLEFQGLINRDIECLPTQKEIERRRSEGQGFTNPELAILQSYAKMTLVEQIKKSDIADDPDFDTYLTRAFPDRLCEMYHAEVKGHTLRRHIIATQLSASLVSDMGFSFVYQMQDELSVSVSHIIRAYVIAKNIYNMDDIFAEIASLDFSVSYKVQVEMRRSVVYLVRRITRWLVRTLDDNLPIAKTIAKYKSTVNELYEILPKLLLGEGCEKFNSRRLEYVDNGVPAELARRIASGSAMYHMMNVLEANTVINDDIFRVAKTYFMLADRLGLFWFRNHINEFNASNKWSVLAKAVLKSDLDNLQADLTIAIFRFNTDAKSIPVRINSWVDANAQSISQWETMLGDIKTGVCNDFSIMLVGVKHLLALAKESLATDKLA